MQREIAESLMEKIGWLNNCLESLPDIVSSAEIEHEEKKNYLKGIARTLASCYVNLMRPIIKEYPDLDPDKEIFDSFCIYSAQENENSGD